MLLNSRLCRDQADTRVELDVAYQTSKMLVASFMVNIAAEGLKWETQQKQMEQKLQQTSVVLNMLPWSWPTVDSFGVRASPEGKFLLTKCKSLS